MLVNGWTLVAIAAIAALLGFSAGVVYYRRLRRTKAKRLLWWLLYLTGAALLVAAAWAAPLIIVHWQRIPVEPADVWNEAVGHIRTWLVTGAGIIGAIYGLRVNAANTRLLARQVQIAEREAAQRARDAETEADTRADAARQQSNAVQAQLALAESGQVTERFTRAVEQLAHDDATVRLGGVYGLERVARDSAADWEHVVEVLVSYVRQRRWKHDTEVTGSSVPEEIQRVIDVLGRLVRPPHSRLMLNFTDLELPRIRISGPLFNQPLPTSEPNTSTIGVTFNGANLAGAHISAATACSFRRTVLTGAILSNADLRGVGFDAAVATGTGFSGAELSDACFLRADLREAWFFLADLEGADFQEADLRGANFEQATVKPPVDGDPVGCTHFALAIVNEMTKGIDYKALGVKPMRVRSEECPTRSGQETTIVLEWTADPFLKSADIVEEYPFA